MRLKLQSNASLNKRDGCPPKGSLYQCHILVYVIVYNWVDKYRCSYAFWRFCSQSKTWGIEWYIEIIPEGISDFMMHLAKLLGLRWQQTIFEDEFTWAPRDSVILGFMFINGIETSLGTLLKIFWKIIF